jgi:hypothetical protein
VSKTGRRRSRQGDQQELERLRAEVKSFKRFGFFSTTGKVLCEAARASRTVLPFLFIWLCIRDWPQHTLSADLKADLKGNVGVESETLSEALTSVLSEYTLFGSVTLLAVFAIGYGKYQAKLRRDDVEQLSRYKEKYEKSVDPARSSSRLTERGDTRPEDE